MTKRIIKKYPNRRLYDTTTSKYITVDGIRELIVSGSTVQIIEDASGDDITRGVLVQVLSQQEQGGQPVLSDRALTHLIRYYGHPLQAFMGGYIDKSLDAFSEQQEILEQNVNKAMKDSPALAMQKAFADMTTTGMKSWNEMQQAFFDQLTAASGNSDKDTDAKN